MITLIRGCGSIVYICINWFFFVQNVVRNDETNHHISFRSQKNDERKLLFENRKLCLNVRGSTVRRITVIGLG